MTRGEVCPVCGDTGPHYICWDRAGLAREDEVECRTCGEHFDPAAP